MNINIVEIVENVSRSSFSIQHLISGLAYILGILFFITALKKFRAIGEEGHGENLFVPLAYLVGGASLIFLPTIYAMVSNTVFGVGNILQYTSYNPYNFYSSMITLIRTAGLVWFVRGSILITQSSEPGTQHGHRGLLFLFAGILSMNIETTISWVNWLVATFISDTLNHTAPT